MTNWCGCDIIVIDQCKHCTSPVLYKIISVIIRVTVSFFGPGLRAWISSQYQLMQLSVVLQLMVMLLLKGSEESRKYSPEVLRCLQQQCRWGIRNDLWSVSLKVHDLVTVWNSRSVTKDYPETVFYSVQRSS